MHTIREPWERIHRGNSTSLSNILKTKVWTLVVRSCFPPLCFAGFALLCQFAFLRSFFLFPPPGASSRGHGALGPRLSGRRAAFADAIASNRTVRQPARKI